MGSLASAKIVALPMVEKHSDPEPTAAAVKPSAVDISAAVATASASAPVTAPNLL